MTEWIYVYKFTNYITFVSPKAARLLESANFFVRSQRLRGNPGYCARHKAWGRRSPT
jgi:hypothetical protein